MITQEQEKLIEKYLDDVLSGEDISRFQHHFRSNPQFASEVKKYTDMRIALKSAAITRLSSPKETGKTITAFFFVKMAVAASVLFFIGFQAYNFIKPNPYHQMFAQYYVNPSDRIDQKARSSVSDNDKQTITRFNKAIDAIENRKFAVAMEILTDLHNIENDLLADEIAWHLALCHVRLKNTEEAKDMLPLLFNTRSAFSRQALDLYNQLLDMENK